MITLDRKELAGEMSLLAQIAGSKNVIPALSTVRVEARDGSASLLASNGDVALFTSVSAAGKDWKGCVPARQLYDLVRLTSGVEKIDLTPQESILQISWGRSRHRLPVIDFDKFPEVDSLTAEIGSATVKAEDFKTALERVLPCADRSNTAKWMVQGVKLEAKDGELKIIGTNTHRLGVATISAEGILDLFVPLGAALLLPKLDAEFVTIQYDGQRASFTSGSRIMIARLVAGIFPDWKAFMPSYFPLSVKLNSRDLVDALKRADITRDETFKIGVGRILLGVTLVFGKEELIIDTKQGDRGRSEESVSVESNLNGDLIYMGINPDYVMDFLKTAGETTECSLKDGSTVLRMTDGSNFEYVVVPLRV